MKLTKQARAKRKYMEIYITELLTKLDKKGIIDFDFQLTFNADTTYVGIESDGKVYKLNIDHKEILKADYHRFPETDYDEFFLNKGYDHYIPYLLHELGHIKHARENFEDYYYKNTMQRMEAHMFILANLGNYIHDEKTYGILAHYQTSIEKTANHYGLMLYKQLKEENLL